MKNQVTALVASACIGLFGIGASAQELAIEEILVTATKRSQSVQDVPVAVNAVDQDTIEALNIDEFTDITRISPSLTVNQGDWATNSGFNLRGIGTNVFSINIEPSVAIIIDDVPLVRSAQAFSDLLDIERIEVLRGPQSTLFGKSASAGVINIATQGPGEEFNARFRAGMTDDDELSLAATAGIPISDVLGLRVSAFHKDRDDGHIDNVFDGAELNGDESSGARAKLVWDASDTVTATFKAEFSESESTCCARPYRDVPSTAAFLGAFPAAAIVGGLNVGEDNDEVSVDDPTTTESDSWGVGARFEIALGEFELLSITSYDEWEYDVSTDVDGTSFDLLAAFTGGALSGGLVQGGGFQLDSLSQEFRLVSPASERFEYVVGLYYSEVNYDRDFNRGPLFAADWVAETGNEQLALYGQGTLGLGENTNLIFGIRFNTEEISHSFDNALSGLSFSGSDDETAVPGKIGVQHFLNDDVMFYATYSIGYKGQGYDISSSFGQNTSDNPVGSEDSTSFELGMKATFFDGRLQLNPTIFFAEYDDFQAQQARIVGGVVELGISNVGKLETTGIEIDFQALLSENLRLVGGLAYVDAEIKDFSGADCYPGQTAAQGCQPILDAMGMPTGSTAQDLGGKDLNNSPDLKFTLSAEYDLPLGNLPFDGFVNLSYQWQDDVNFSLLADPGAEQDAYGIVNFSAGIQGREHGYEVTLFVNNLLDEDYASGIGNVGGLWGGSPVYIQTYPREANRYVGLRVGFSI
ncbi:MAG: TonB-dependent receptor [Pseudomonadaceae bacterium]|nr:TonB-dependent receptor [Pseudomonadaceae bacterium]